MKKTLIILSLASLLATAPAVAETSVAPSEQESRILTPRPGQVAPLPSRTANPSDVVRAFYDQLRFVMQKGPQLGFAGRYDRLKPAIERSFNLPLMARFAVGPTWAQTDAAHQRQLIKAFSDFSVSTYASRFKKYDGETFEILGEKPSSGGAVIVETRLTPSGDAPVMLNYLMRKDERGAWRIADVYLDATISELAVRRSEFSAIVQRQGVDALISTLGAKVKQMQDS